MSITRRGLVGGLLTSAGLLAATGAKAGDPTKRFTGYQGRYGLLHDTTLCIGCRSCEVACYEINDIAERQQRWGKKKDPPKPVGDMSVFDKKRHSSDASYTIVNRYREAKGGNPAVFRKHQCMHCNEPCCAAVCFVGAFKKTPEGPVEYDPSVCVGCRYCVMACPYYALSYEYDDPFTPRVVRCTMCLPRIRQGKLPGCASACPTGAIIFGERKKLLQIAHQRIRKQPARYLDHVFGQHEFGGTSWLVLAGIPFGKLGLPEDATHRPLPELIDGALSTVPLIVSMWPALLLGMHAFSKRKEKLSQQELEKALSESRSQAADELKQKIAEAAKKGRKDQERAVERAVKKAKAEALKEAQAQAEAKEKEGAS